MSRTIAFTQVNVGSDIKLKLIINSGQVEYSKEGILHKVKDVPYTYGSTELLEDAKKLATALKIDETEISY